jgi:hypothetical protein
MRSYCSEWPEFHPEFGLLCPSNRQRRFVRLATIFVMSIIVIGASRGLAAAHRADPDEMFVAMLPHDDDLPVEMAALEPTGSDEIPAPPRDPCKGLGPDDLAGYLLNPGCKIQGRHGQHKSSRLTVITAGRIELQLASLAPAPPSALTIAMQQVAAKVAETEKRASGATQKTASLKKHKQRENAPVELARAPSRPGGMPNTLVTAYTTESKLTRSHGPFNDSFPRKHTSAGL